MKENPPWHSHFQVRVSKTAATFPKNSPVTEKMFRRNCPGPTLRPEPTASPSSPMIPTLPLEHGLTGFSTIFRQRLGIFPKECRKKHNSPMALARDATTLKRLATTVLVRPPA